MQKECDQMESIELRVQGSVKSEITLKGLQEENDELRRQLDDLRHEIVLLEIRPKQALCTDESLSLALNGSGIGIWDANISTGEVSVDQGWHSTLGYDTSDEMDCNLHWEDFIHPDDKHRMMHVLDSPLSPDHAVFEIEYRMRSKDGSWKWFFDRGKVVEWSQDGHPLRVVGTNRNISRQKQAEEQLKKMAMYDVLTGLPNRRFCEDLLSKEVSLAGRNRFKLGLGFLDVDDFKGVNDRYGHEIGDLLLKQISGRILHCLRDSDSVSRFGGDEFVIVLKSNDRLGYEYIVKRLLEVLSRPFDLNGIHIDITCSMGVSVFPDNASTVEGLLKKADEAMYQVKHRGKNNYLFS